MKRLNFLLVFLLAIPTVLAKDLSQSIGETLYKIFGFIFVDLSKRAGTSLYYFYIKFMLWVLIFAILYYASKFVFKEQHRIQIAVSFIIALLSVVMIPDKVIIWIVQGYTITGAFILLAIPIVGVILLNHYAFNQPGRAFYAIKAVIYYLLAMLIYNVAQVTANYNIFSFSHPSPPGSDWIGFAEGVCILLMLWNAFRAIFPPGEEEEKASASSPLSNLFKEKPVEKGARKEEIKKEVEGEDKKEEDKKEVKAKTEAEKGKRDKEKLDKLLEETIKKEEELRNEINKIMQRINEMNAALRGLSELEKKSLEERKEALKLILRWIEAIESAYKRLEGIDKDVKDGKVFNSEKLREYRSKLAEYIQQGLKKINSLFDGVSKSILEEYKRILDDKKPISGAILEAVKKEIDDYVKLDRLEELDTRLTRFVKDIENRLSRLSTRASAHLHVNDRRAIINSVTVLLNRLRTIQRETSRLTKELREETKYMLKFEIEDRKTIEEQRKKEEKNKSLVSEIRNVLNKLLIEPSSKLFSSLKDKINSIYKNTEIEENDVIIEENYEAKLKGFIAKWEELNKRKKEVDDIKLKIENELKRISVP